MINVNEIANGDVFSEISHYVASGKTATEVIFKHSESGAEVKLDYNYVENLLKTADQYSKIVEVGKEDKLWTKKQIEEGEKKNLFGGTPPNVGDLKQAGIRTLFEEIYSSQVFTAKFYKADTKMPAKKFKQLRDDQIATAIEKIEKTATQKKGVAAIAKEVITEIQNNPIFDVVPGELRTLRGYKIQFKSRDGRYDCIDADLAAPDNVRPVNINTLQELIFDGVKYVLEK